MSDFIQEDSIDELRRSKAIVGELNPIVKDRRTGQTISGKHREQVGWSKVVWVDTKDDLQLMRLKIHYNVQRQKPPKEWASELTEYAELMAKSGSTNPEIVKELISVSPFGKSFTYEFIPQRFKSMEGRPRGQFPGVETKPAAGFSVAPPVDEPRKEELVTCSSCGLRGTVIAHVLQQG